MRSRSCSSALAAVGSPARASPENRISAGPALTTVFPGTDIGQQFNQVAKIIQLRAQTGVKRQVFFCALGGFDTHGGQSYQQWQLLKQLGAAMSAFYNVTAEMGIADKVTTFTESDFGRTLQPANGLPQTAATFLDERVCSLGTFRANNVCGCPWLA